MDATKQLGEEKISKLLIKFSIPCIMGLLISAFYNIVDQIFIGNSELGFLGNAATGISFPIICIANAFAWCIGDGAASYLSICAGRNDKQSAHKCIGTGITISFSISIILMIVCYLFATPLMNMFGASAQTLDMAVTYFKIIALGFPVYLLINVMNSMIRADGSPTYAMIAMLIGAITNIILDPVFIYIFKWGIAGAAYATVIGQVLSFITCIVYFRKPKSFKLTLKSFIPNGPILMNTVKLGASTFVTQISIVIVSLTCNIMLAKYGALSVYGADIPISVFSIQTKVSNIVLNIVVGIVLGGQPIFGYNYGAGKMNRVKEAYMIVLKATILVCIIATLIFQLCPQVIINIFGAGNDLYLEFAIMTFRIYMSLTIATCLVKMSAIFFQSIGKSIHAVLASLVRDIVCFTPLAIFLPMILENGEVGKGIYGILYAAPIADAIAIITVLVMTIPFFKNLTEKVEEPTKTYVIQPSTPGVIVTIAREHGSKGKQIGNKVAQYLNIPFYYKEMTAIAAQESGLDKEFMQGINENAPSVLHDLYLSTNVLQQAVVAQEKVIRKIADNGSCVIVGRAADYVLKDYDQVVKIFIYAPKEFRIQNIMEMYGDTYEQAVHHVKRSDDARSAYYRTISSQQWGDPHNYDLCIDASIGEEECAKCIVDYIRFRQKEDK